MTVSASLLCLALAAGAPPLPADLVLVGGKVWVATERGNAPARRLYAVAGGIEGPEVVVVSFRPGARE